MKIDRDDLYVLIGKYQEEMSTLYNEEYDKGYVDGIVDILGDLITFLDMDELNPFSDAMEEIQNTMNEWKV
jgi:hypothetical protein